MLVMCTQFESVEIKYSLIIMYTVKESQRVKLNIKFREKKITKTTCHFKHKIHNHIQNSIYIHT